MSIKSEKIFLGYSYPHYPQDLLPLEEATPVDILIFAVDKKASISMVFLPFITFIHIFHPFHNLWKIQYLRGFREN